MSFFNLEMAQNEKALNPKTTSVAHSQQWDDAFSLLSLVPVSFRIKTIRHKAKLFIVCPITQTLKSNEPSLKAAARGKNASLFEKLGHVVSRCIILKVLFIFSWDIQQNWAQQKSALMPIFPQQSHAELDQERDNIYLCEHISFSVVNR